MARIGSEPDFNLSALFEFSDCLISQVILHVAVPRDKVRNVVGREFREDHLKRFFQEIRQDIEPAAVGHPHANFLDPLSGAALQNRVQNHHERLRALK